MGSGEMGFAGINALARAKLAIEVVQERLRRRGLSYEEMRVDLIGMNSLHANDAGAVPGTLRGAPAHRRAHAGQEGRRGGRRGSAQPAHARSDAAPAAASISARGRYWR